MALSGPTHAEEVAIDLPTTIVSASKDMEAARFVQTVFTNNVMRVYTNEDIKGVELSGAMKNVIALGVGISTGLGYGDNARAALITRGIAELARLGVAMGCNVHTFAGLAGIGDLIVTATSMHSRNNRAGILIGKGETPEQAVKEVGMVVEGMNALPAALELAAKYCTGWWRTSSPIPGARPATKSWKRCISRLSRWQCGSSRNMWKGSPTAHRWTRPMTTPSENFERNVNERSKAKISPDQSGTGVDLIRCGQLGVCAAGGNADPHLLQRTG